MKTDWKDILFRKRLIILIGVLLTVAAAPVGILTFNQYRDAEATVSDALRRDAQSYASDYGVGLDEAIRRLQLQETIGDFDSQLQSNEAGTFGGLWIEHGPARSDFKVVVRFTSGGEQTIQKYGKYVASGPLSGIVEVRDAEATLTTLKANRDQAVGNLADLGISVESGINVIENQVEIYVVERDRLDTAITDRGIELPSKAELITVGSLSSKATDIYGGLMVRKGSKKCTSGFSVEDDDGNLGVTTAGHCVDDLTFNGTSLTYEDGQFNGSLDLQWHTSDFDEVNKVYDGDSNPREMDSTRSSHSVGQYVCKYGIESDYSCGIVMDVNVEPTEDSGCHPGACDWDDDWVRVRSSSDVDMCTKGDSGGPFFTGGTAVGTMAFCQARPGSPKPSGKNNNDDAIYMKVGFFDDLDLTVLTD